MNPQTNTKRILCYGDSNTWGRSGRNTERYPIHVRWTGLLQADLGEQFEVIEEGLRSRTTNLNDDDPLFPGRNGLTYLRPCLESHNPLDLVILWLGTNDLKSKFNRTPKDITAALEKLVTEIKQVAHNADGKTSAILLIAPPLVREQALGANSDFVGAGEKSEQLGALYETMAQKTSCLFLNLAMHTSPGGYDGIHLEPAEHLTVAELIAEKIKAQ